MLVMVKDDPPLFVIVKSLGLLDSLLGVILVQSASNRHVGARLFGSLEKPPLRRQRPEQGLWRIRRA